MKKKNCLIFVLSLLLLLTGGFVPNKLVYGINAENKLMEPEEGWKRYNDDFYYIDYSNNFVYGNDIEYYNNNIHQVYYNSEKEYARFSFDGTKLRIIGSVHPSYPEKAHIIIDGIEYSFNINNENYITQVVLFEIQGLEERVHQVELYQDEASDVGLALDAIDIDNFGVILPYTDERNEGIELNTSKLSLGYGEVGILYATTTPAGATVNWSSSDDSIVRVDQNGILKGLEVGKAIISANLAGTCISDYCEVTVTTSSTVTVEPNNPSYDERNKGIELDQSSIELEELEFAYLYATTTPAGATVNWSSCDESIAKVNEYGMVTGISAGETQIIANLDGTSLYDYCNVTVTTSSAVTFDPNNPSNDERNKGIELYQPYFSLEEAETWYLYATTTPAGATVNWSSSNDSIVAVNQNGKIAGIAPGKAIITANLAGTSLRDFCEVTVTTSSSVTARPNNPNNPSYEERNKGIQLDKPSFSLEEAELGYLYATTTPAGATVNWSSSNDSIVTVNQNGKIAGIAPGKAIVIANIAGTSLRDFCQVTVTTSSAVTVNPNKPSKPSVDEEVSDGSLYIEMVDGNIKHATNININDFINWYINRDADKTESPVFKITNAKGKTEYLIHDKIVAFEIR